ncbi:RNA polymerase sigma factor [Pedobacter hartonius]|uniref:RNA polymerase sigma-70 factor, ECF subfamily n=1 Tax=Pedobacter hartonius TaxID=425514 RepID=A0A1H3YNV7_9SPHI|nr:RNA polymerase sigma-70 factor [Pedobacter hartonius]SEA13215.1 RNA polymerase sigma-70 factor, ECF subfamily [Pedobacter hartonius]
MFQTQTSDLQLWASIRQDDESAFNELFKRYWIRLYKTAYQYLKDKEASEEVVHDVFLNIWDRRGELEILTFSSYMLTAIRYQIYNRMRAAKSPLIYGDDQIPMNNFPDYNSAENKIEEQELHQEVYSYLQSLPKRCQEIFCMSRIDQLSNDEIALRLGISKRSVENQITIALKHLRICLKHLAAIMLMFL